MIRSSYAWVTLGPLALLCFVMCSNSDKGGSTNGTGGTNAATGGSENGGDGTGGSEPADAETGGNSDDASSHVSDASALVFNPCVSTSGSTYGTSGSATFAVMAAGFAAKNLTISNDYAEVGSSGLQAVALLTQGDKLVFENVRILGNQDTLYLKTPATNVVSRVYIKDSYIEGDTDFIFGRATTVIDHSTLQSMNRKPTGGTVVAPSTAPANPYGFLIISSNFTADTAVSTNGTYLGRAWDEGVSSTSPYVAGTSPNGQALIRDSMLGVHIRVASPWASSTSSRPFDVSANRLFEYNNSGPGSLAGNGSVADGGTATSDAGVEYSGTATRPLLTAEEAADETISAYLASSGTLGALTTDNWDPTAGLGDVSTFTPTYTVASDGSGTHTSVQAAIVAATAAGGTSPARILVKPGTYRELVCVKSGAPPITLYGASADATQVQIVFDNYSGKSTVP